MAPNGMVRYAEIVRRVEVEAGQVVVRHLEHLGILPGRVVGAEGGHVVAGFSLAAVRRFLYGGGRQRGRFLAGP